jgi:hypothetical protein
LMLLCRHGLFSIARIPKPSASAACFQLRACCRVGLLPSWMPETATGAAGLTLLVITLVAGRSARPSDDDRFESRAGEHWQRGSRWVRKSAVYRPAAGLCTGRQ